MDTTTWMSLGNTLLSERSRTREKLHIIWLHSREMSRVGKIAGAESKWALAGGLGGAEGKGKWLFMDPEFLSGLGSDENVLKLLCWLWLHSGWVSFKKEGHRTVAATADSGVDAERPADRGWGPTYAWRPRRWASSKGDWEGGVREAGGKAKRGLEEQLSPWHRWAPSLCPCWAQPRFYYGRGSSPRRRAPRGRPWVCLACDRGPELRQELVHSGQHKTHTSSGDTCKGQCQWVSPRAPAIWAPGASPQAWIIFLETLMENSTKPENANSLSRAWAAGWNRMFRLFLGNIQVQLFGAVPKRDFHSCFFPLPTQAPQPCSPPQFKVQLKQGGSDRRPQGQLRGHQSRRGQGQDRGLGLSCPTLVGSSLEIRWKMWQDGGTQEGFEEFPSTPAVFWCKHSSCGCQRPGHSEQLCQVGSMAWPHRNLGPCWLAPSVLWAPDKHSWRRRKQGV